MLRKFKVAGMSCSHCKQAVESAVLDIAGVRTAEADVNDGTLVVTVEAGVSDEMIRTAVEEQGFMLA